MLISAQNTAVYLAQKKSRGTKSPGSHPFLNPLPYEKSTTLFFDWNRVWHFIVPTIAAHVFAL